MKYILVDSALSFMLESFPRKAVPDLYNSFCDKCDSGEIICDKETKKSLENLLEEETSFEWLKEHNKLFKSISQKESKILGDLVDEGCFDFVNKSNSFTRNIPITIPFVFAVAINEDRVVVADKKSNEYSVINSLCKKKEVTLMDIDDFLSHIA